MLTLTIQLLEVNVLLFNSRELENVSTFIMENASSIHFINHFYSLYHLFILFILFTHIINLFILFIYSLCLFTFIHFINYLYPIYSFIYFVNHVIHFIDLFILFAHVNNSSNIILIFLKSYSIMILSKKNNHYSNLISISSTELLITRTILNNRHSMALNEFRI